MALWPISDEPPSSNKVRNKETNEKMHGRNARSGKVLNQGRLDENPIA